MRHGFLRLHIKAGRHLLLGVFFAVFFMTGCTPSEDSPQRIQVLSISPASGDIFGGNEVTITGNNFSFVDSVKFGLRPCTDLIVTETLIRCKAPATTVPEVVSVTVSGKANRSDVLSYEYVIVNPTVTSFTPTSGPLEGNNSVFITGSGFNPGSVASINDVNCAITSVMSSTLIECYANPGVAGSYDVKVSNPNGSVVTAPTQYRYNPLPTISAASPITGSTTGGATLTITGTGFLSGARVTIGTTRCGTVNVVSSTQLTCTIQPGTAGLYGITVTNTDGQSATLSNAFTYFNVPYITSITPTAGQLAGGDSITITGRYFTQNSTVNIGGIPCANLTYNNATSLTCVTPVNVAGTYSMTVQNPSTTSSTFTPGFTYQAGPTITGVSPAAGPLAGGNSIVISGTNFRSLA